MIKNKNFKFIVTILFLSLLCSSSLAPLFLLRDNKAIKPTTLEQDFPKLQAADNIYLLHFYNFEDNVVGEDPFGTSLEVKEEPVDGSVEVSNLGDDQQNHVLMHKIDRSEGKRVWVRDNVSFYGSTYQAGEIHFRMYKHDDAGFEVGVATANLEAAIHIWFWNGQIRDKLKHIYEGGTGYIADHPLNQWYEVILYFDLSQGWMLDLDGVRYGDGYSFGFYEEFTEGVSHITYSSFASAGGSGYARFDDIAFYSYYQSISKILLDDSDPSSNWEWASNQPWCGGSGTEFDPYIIEGVTINGLNIGNCILIRNSDKYFIIRNCKLMNSGTNTFDAGIKLVNTNNGNLIKNNCSNNGRYGINLQNSHNNNISENIACNNRASGIGLYYSDNNQISENSANNNILGAGIKLYQSDHNLILGNIVNNGESAGMDMQHCYYNEIIGNIINDNRNHGIFLSIFDYNTISGNTVSNNNGIGIFIDHCYNNVIWENTVTYNEEYGIYIFMADYYSIKSNNVSNNGDIGLLFSASNNNTILENYISHNEGIGLYIAGNSGFSNVYQNFFITNDVNAKDDGNGNKWDNGKVGNYWDDYDGVDANHDNIGDTPYYVPGNAGSRDNFPLFYLLVDFAIYENDIQFEIGVGETDVYATITNNLASFEEDIVVQFLEEEPDGSILLIGSEIIQGLDKDEQKTISFRWTPKIFHFIIVSIDPDNLIFEMDENNNVAKKGGGGSTPTIGNVWSYFGKWFDANTVGNFFKSLYLINTFYAEIIDLDGPNDVVEVIFKIGGEEFNGIKHDENIWKFSYNMGKLTTGDNTLEITARDTLDLVSETRIIIIKVIEIPSWITDFTDEIFSHILPDWIRIEGFTIYITFEVGADGGDKTLPTDIPNVGGGEMGPDIEITFTFSFNLLSLEAQLKVAGSFEFKTSFAGRDVKISLEVSGTGKFGPGFVLTELEIEIKLELSLTIWGYGVSAAHIFKIGIGLDLEFKFALTFIFRVIDNILQWAESNLELQIGILGWAEFKLNLGFLGVTARCEAGGGIILDFIWSETEGFSWGFDLYLRVGYILDFRFLWWRWRSSGSYEWRLFDRSPAEMNKTVVEVPLNYTKDYSNLMDSRPRVATDKNGKAMMVWTHNRNQSGKMYTDLCYSTWNGTDWEDARYITYDNNSDFDPAIAYDSYGNVFVVWSRFRDDLDSFTTEDPIDLLEYQEIAYSMWDGSKWTEPKLITNGTYANGRAVVSAGQNGDLITVWVGDPDHNFTTTKDMELFYSVWNGTHWSGEKQLTNNEYMDYSASLAHDSLGNSMICWIRDLDGNRSTTSDNQLLYSLWEGNGWSEPSTVIDSDESKETPSITYDLNDNLLITWVGRNETMSKLYFASWDKTTEEWSAPEIVHEEGFFIFNPAINVDPNNTAVIVWRGFEDDAAERAYYLTHNATDTYFDGEICYATKDLTRPDSVWSELKYLTSNNKTDWMASAVIIRGFSNDLLLVWDMEGEVSNLVHEIKPDLFINASDIVFSNQHPMEGERINITATIYNIGDVITKDISVYFYNGDPNNGGILIGTGFVDLLDYDAKQNIIIPWDAQPGSNNIYVVIDPEKIISEIKKDNNIAFNTIYILPDLTLSSTDISFSNPNPLEGEEIFINALIHNLGGTRAENIIIEFYDDSGYIGNDKINVLEAYDSAVASVKWIVPAGISNITVIIDLADVILEWNNTNNNATTTIFVYPDIELIDFNVSNEILIYGENVELTVEIQNIGGTLANNIVLEFYDGDPNIDGVLLHTAIISSLNISEKKSYPFTWKDPPPGTHKMFAIIDRQNSIDESDETNNLLFQELMVINLPDLTISEPEFAYTTEYIEINIPVENIGSGGATGIVLDLYDGNPFVNGELWISHLITYIGGGKSTIDSFKLSRPPKFEDLYIFVDLVDNIEELNEANNQFVISYSDILKVDAGPDQQVEEGEIVQFSAILFGGMNGDFTFQWDFGDGFSEEGVNPTHQYGDNGIYNVHLTVTGPNFVSYDDLIVTVLNVAPVVNAGLDQIVNEDDTVSFTGSFVDPGSKDTHTFEWDFGDGQVISDTLIPDHVYTDKGTHTVTLTITDDDGGIGTDTMIVTVLNVIPIAAAAPNQSIYDDEIAVFNASNSWDTPSDLPNLSFEWDFGDGTSGTGPVISHSYSELGTFLVTLTVMDDDGAVDTDTCTVVVQDDDITPPELTDLLIIDDIHFVTISLNASDESGIDFFNIFVDGELIELVSQTQIEDIYTFILENQWILKEGIYQVDIQAVDADNDIITDSLSSWISGTFEITIGEMYQYVDWQLEELKNYIDSNLVSWFRHLIIRKLSQAQNYLNKALDYLENGEISMGVLYDSKAKSCVTYAENIVEKLSNVEEIINRLRVIRNNIVILKGTSSQVEKGYDVALIEIELLNLYDVIKQEINWKDGLYLNMLIRLAAENLELAIYKISLGINPENSLRSAQLKLELAINEINRLLNKGKISQELADTLLGKINQIYLTIEEVKNSI